LAAVVVVPLIVMLIPGAPVYLPDLFSTKVRHGGHSVAYWTTALQSPDAEARRQAIFALGAIGPKAGEGVPALSAIMTDDPDRQMRSEAALALYKMAPASQAAVPALSRALQDEGPLVRMYAALALFQLREQARPAVPALIQGLKDDANNTFLRGFSMTVREMMVQTLARASAGTADAVPALTEALESAKTDNLRVTAVRALGEVGPAARSAAPALEALLKDKNRRVQEAAREALDKIKPGQAADGKDKPPPPKS
jgi:HEAT repeat protein